MSNRGATTPRDPNLVDKGCPWCNALPDEACITPNGKLRNDHEAREYGEPDDAD